MSQLTDRLKLFAIKKGKEKGATHPDEYRFIFDGIKLAYYNGTPEFKENFRKEMDELGV